MAATQNVIVIVDGGGTSTAVATVYDHSIIARREFPSHKPDTRNPRTDELCKVLGSWLASTLSPDTFPRWVLLGMAGLWTDNEKQQYLNSFADSWSAVVSPDVPRISVISDVELVHLAAHGNTPGIVLIAGTGSICIARFPDGRMLRCGGWGPRLDDAGGGFWLGRRALQAVAQMLDGRGPDTLLIRPVATYLRVDAEDHAALSEALRNVNIDRCATLGQSVLTFAAGNDVVALGIREEGADELSKLVITMVHDLNKSNRDLDTSDRETESIKIAFAGSLFNDYEYRESVSVRIVNDVPNVVMKFVDDVIAAAATILDEK